MFGLVLLLHLHSCETHNDMSKTGIHPQGYFFFTTREKSKFSFSDCLLIDLSYKVQKMQSSSLFMYNPPSTLHILYREWTYYVYGLVCPPGYPSSKEICLGLHRQRQLLYIKHLWVHLEIGWRVGAVDLNTVLQIHTVTY